MQENFAFTPEIFLSVETPAVFNEKWNIYKMQKKANSQISITYLNHNGKRKWLK